MAENKPETFATKPASGVDPKLLQLADQLGTLLGTARAKADQWLDREALTKELGRIRDGAADLLAQVNRAAAASRKAAAPPAAAAANPVAAPVERASRGPVDAPGKRHRKPPPQVRLDKRMGEVVGKKMGKKSVKHAMKGRA
jgi:hypothetical protein